MRHRSSFVLLVRSSFAACGPSSRDNVHGGDVRYAARAARARRASATTAQDGHAGRRPVPRRHADVRVGGGSGAPAQGEVVPVGENCGDGIDNNCNGTIDEDVDCDGDGFTTCGGDCCDSTECSESRARVTRARSMRRATASTTTATASSTTRSLLCDQGLTSNSTNAMDYAKAIDLCQTATMTDKKWGVISATLTLADGTGTPDAKRALDPPALRHRRDAAAAASAWRCSRPAPPPARATRTPPTTTSEHGYSAATRRPASRRTSSRRTAARCRTRPGCPGIRAARRERSGDADADDPRPDQREVVLAQVELLQLRVPRVDVLAVQRLLRRAARLDVHRHAGEPDGQEPRVLPGAEHDARTTRSA